MSSSTSSNNGTNYSSSNESESEEESLISQTSLNLSLSPPRFAPYYTAQRSLYKGQDPTNHSLALHHSDHYQHVDRKADLVHPFRKREYQRVHDLLVKIFLGKDCSTSTVTSKGDTKNQNKKNSSLRKKVFIPHPHLSFSPETPDQISRLISSHILPLKLQNKYRDDGTFRSLCDLAVTCSVPSLAFVNPKAAREFITLTKDVMKQISYGTIHESQKIDLFLPLGVDEDDIRGLVFFVHGGAWGSGMPWMYRLVSTPFLESNIAVAIVGYRTYPDGNAQDQIDDLLQAAQTLARLYPKLWYQKRKNDSSSFGVSLIGHSSGAHISLLLLVQLIEKHIKNQVISGSKILKNHKDDLLFDSYVGLSGVYNIQHHFDYEAGRGVEEISPMKPACGYSREAFDYHSPAVKLKSLMKMMKMKTSSHSDHDQGSGTVWTADHCMMELIPPMLLVHGMEDDTVPFTSTSEAARIIKSCGARQCSEYYISKTGHSDVVMQFMLGGRSPDIVIDWLLKAPKKSQRKVDNISSKL